MGQPAAKANDQVVGTDIHLVMVPAGPALVPTPLPHPFSGLLDGSLRSTVTIGGQAAATVGSTATNQPAHLPTPPGTSFVTPPTNRATVMLGERDRHDRRSSRRPAPATPPRRATTPPICRSEPSSRPAP